MASRNETARREALGAFVRKRRRSLGLTQTQLANRIGWVQERISLLEHGKHGTPSLGTLARISEGMETSLGEILHAMGYAWDGVLPSGHADFEPQSSTALLHTLERLLQSQVTSMRSALDEACDSVARAIGADQVDAFLFDSEIESLVAVGASRALMAARQRQIGMDRLPVVLGGRIVEAYRTGHVFHTGHADLDERVHVGFTDGLGIRSIIAVPLEIVGERRGVLLALSTQAERFKAEEIRFVAAVARWIQMAAQQDEWGISTRQDIAG